MADPPDAPDQPDAPQTLIEPTTGRPVMLAPRRQQRPKLTDATHGNSGASACPFCPGAEAETMPELDAIRTPGTLADAPGWRVRAFANKYPANADHEVVVEGDRHCEQPGELDASIWADVVRIWQRRIAAIEARERIACAFLFKNVGARAGASIVHNHSQILGLERIPPRLELERERAAAQPSCPWCAALASAEAEGRLLVRGPAHAWIVPPVPRLPYETWLLPLACEDDFLQSDAEALGELLRRAFVAIAEALDRPALNLWLHRIPAGDFHWHFELQPRRGQLAGLELGAEISINSVPPRQAAARLRAALDRAPRAAARPSPAAADRG